MRIQFFSLLLLAASLQAQTFGLTIGASAASPQSIQGIQPETKSAFAGALSARGERLSFAITYRADSLSKIENAGEVTSDSFAWGFAGLQATVSLPLGFSIGAEARRERLEAKSATDGTTVSGSASRLWARVAWEHETIGESASTAFGVSASFAKREGVDSSSPERVLRAYAPSAEFQVFMTIRFGGMR